jgi:2-polyprenyl-6-hydroxyphenyl methylase/3-demethylubiquinone-9 3-methyltransferase
MLDDRQLFYERFAGEFDSRMSRYDTEKRVRIVFERLLPESLAGRELLDAGSGTGWFSREAVRRGARVTSLDVGPRLLEEVARKCDTRRVVGDVCALDFPRDSFDVVVSSEVIEHVAEPRRAVSEMARVLRPGGILALTTPNRRWHFAIALANRIGARPYEGYENWVGWSELRRWVTAEGLAVEAHFGFHLFPFVVPATHALLDRLDRLGGALGPVMLNQAIRGRKPSA